MSVSQHTINSFQFRAEMCVHTKFGLMNSCTEVYSLFEHAKERGITAIAITDTNSVRAFPHAEFAAKKFGVKPIYGCELLMTDGEDPFHILAYVQTQKGLKNLYHLLSIALDRKEKTVTREEVESYRDGLLIGGSDEILNAALHGADMFIGKIAEFYDAIPITVTDLTIWPEIVDIGDDTEKPVFFVSDVRYLDELEKLAYEILTDKRMDESEKHHLKTSSDLFEECEEFFYEDEICHVRRLICDNTVLFTNRFTEQIRIFPDSEQVTFDDMSEANELEQVIRNRATEAYGDPLPEFISERMERELEMLKKNGCSRGILFMRDTLKQMRAEHIPVEATGALASSFLLYLLEMKEVNPLPAHYCCPYCKKVIPSIPENSRCGVDLPEKICSDCGKPMLRRGFDLPPDFLDDSPQMAWMEFNIPEDMLFYFRGQPSAPLFACSETTTIDATMAYSMIHKWQKKHRIRLSQEEGRKAIRALDGIVRGELEVPNRYILLPDGQDVFDYGPVGSGVLQFDLHHTNLPAVWLHPSEHLLKIERMQMMTGVMHDAIPLDDPALMEQLIPQVRQEDFLWGKELLYRISPQTMEELIQAVACGRSDGAWENNAEVLIENGRSITECICTKEDVLRYLLEFGLNREDAQKLTHFVYCGRSAKKVAAALMKNPMISDWFRESCHHIRHLTSRAHTVQNMLTLLRFAYYKMEFPWEYDIS